MALANCKSVARQDSFSTLGSGSIGTLVAAFAIALSTMLSGAASAQAPTNQNPINQIAQLNATGQSAQAYQLSMQLLPQFEGDPAFDIHYGVAAVDTGNSSEGAFALERVLMNEPANDYARLELGRAYFALEEDDRAKAEFDKVLAANPPAEVIDNVQPYLSAIEARRYKRETSFTANISLGAGYDSNILAAPDQDTFYIPLLNGTATLGTTETDDSFLQFSADALYSKPIRYGTNWFASGQVNKRDNDSGVIDIFGYGGKTGVTHQRGANNYRLALEADALEVDGRGYRDSYGLSASWRHSWTAQTAITLFGQSSQLKYNGNVYKDALKTTTGLAIRHQFIAPLRPVLSLGSSFGFENAENDQLSGALTNTERDIFNMNSSLSLTLRPDLQMTVGGSIQTSDYAGEERLFGVVRQDTQYTGRLGLSWLANDDLVVKLDGSIGTTDSNVPILEYDRNQITLSMRYSYR